MRDGETQELNGEGPQVPEAQKWEGLRGQSPYSGRASSTQGDE